MPLLVDRGAKLVWASDEEATLFSAYFDAKEWRDNFHRPNSSDTFSILCCFAFRSSFVRSLLLDLDPYARNDRDGMFLFFTSR